MMGGKGERFGAQIPKQYTDVEGHPLFTYIISGYTTPLDLIHHIVLVVNRDWIAFVREQMKHLDISIPWEVTEGGQNRSESVRNGLNTAMRTGDSEDIVLIHDATHPYTDIDGTRKVIRAVEEYGGATLAGAEYDTMYRIDTDGFVGDVVPRKNIVSGASPEAFKLGEIYKIYANASENELEQMTSAGAIALAHGIRMKTVQSRYINLKITHQTDMELFLRLKSGYFFK